MSKFKYLVFTGPESSGKSTLVNWLGKKYNLPHNVEYARLYLSQLNRKYTEEDLDPILEGQLSSEHTGHDLFICDSDILTLIIWKEVVYGKTDISWINTFKNYQDRFYFLLKPDIPWQADPLRENPENRDWLFEEYKEKLECIGLPYCVIDGEGKVRQENVLNQFGKVI